MYVQVSTIGVVKLLLGIEIEQYEIINNNNIGAKKRKIKQLTIE